MTRTGLPSCPVLPQLRIANPGLLLLYRFDTQRRYNRRFAMTRLMTRLAAVMIGLGAVAASPSAHASLITYHLDSVSGVAPVGMYNRDVTITVLGDFSIDTLTSQVLPVGSFDLLLDGNSQRPYNWAYDDAFTDLRINGDQSVTHLVFGTSLYNGSPLDLTALVIGGFTATELTGSVAVIDVVGVPEPAGLLLLGLGIGATLRVRRNACRVGAPEPGVRA